MGKNKGRAYRRVQRRRLVAKARKLYPGMKCPAVLADHLAACSCWMCGNPRRWL